MIYVAHVILVYDNAAPGMDLNTKVKICTDKLMSMLLLLLTLCLHLKAAARQC